MRVDFFAEYPGIRLCNRNLLFTTTTIGQLPLPSGVVGIPVIRQMPALRPVVYGSSAGDLDQSDHSDIFQLPSHFYALEDAPVTRRVH